MSGKYITNILYSAFLLLAIFLLTDNFLLAQTATLYDIDHGSYPIIKAKLSVFDDNGQPVNNLTPGDLVLKENDREVVVNSINCNPGEGEAISAILTLDISGSMIGARMAATKAAAKAWVSTMFPGEGECAVVSFNHLNYLNQGFTADQDKLNQAINSLSASGGTDYDAGFYKPPSGALLIADKARYRKVVVFMTDGVTQGNEDYIISLAKSKDVTVYCVTLGIKVPDILKNVCEKTGGMYFDNIYDENQAVTVFRSILGMASAYEACDIEWTSDLCAADREVILSIPSFETFSNSYSIDPSILSGLRYTQGNSIYFGVVQTGSTKRDSLEIEAVNGDIDIMEIRTDNSDFTILNGSAPPSYILKKGQKKYIVVEYTAPDTNYAVANIEIVSSGCTGKYFYASAGHQSHQTSATLELLHPAGGEVFLPGVSDTIRWRGVLPTDTISIEYSLDNKKTWQRLTEKASGLSENWQIPSVVTTRDSCFMRIRQYKEGADKVFLLWADGASVITQAWSPDGTKLAAGTDVGTIIVWNTLTGKRLFVLEDGNQQIINGLSWHPDGKYLVAVSSRSREIKVWDVDKPKIFLTCSADNIDDIDRIEAYYSVAWDPEGFYFAAGSDDGRIAFWNLPSQEAVVAHKIHTLAVTSLSWSPSAGVSKLLSGSRDDTAKITGLSSGLNILSTETLNYNSVINAVDWSHNGQYLAIAGDRNEIDIWDVSDLSNPIETIEAHDKGIQAVGFSSDDVYLASSSLDNTIKIWETSTWIEYYTYTGHTDGVRTCEWNNGIPKRKIAGGSYDATVQVWSPDDIPIEDPLIQEDFSDRWTVALAEIESDDVFFGDVSVGYTHDISIDSYIRNTGDYPVTIDSVVIDDKQVFSIMSGLSNFPIIIPSDDSIEAELRFKPLVSGPVSSDISIYYHGDTLTYRLFGNGKQPCIEFLKEVVDFGKVTIGDNRDIDTLLVRNISGATLNFDNPVITMGGNKGFDFYPSSFSPVLEPGEVGKIRIDFSPIEPGLVQGNLELVFDCSDSPANLPLFGEGLLNGLDVSPRIDFEDMKCVLERDTIEFSVSNIGANTLNIVSVAIKPVSSEFTILDDPSGLQIDPGAEIKATVEFTPDDFDSRVKQSDIEIISFVISGQLDTTYVSVNGKAYDYDMIMQPDDTLDFGIVTENQPAVSTFNISNTGKGDLEWDQVPYTLGKFELTSIDPRILPGKDSEVEVLFSGGAPGIYIEDYIVTDSCGNDHKITFKAEVVRFYASIDNPDSVDFGNRICNQIPPDQDITLLSSGNDTLKITEVILKDSNGDSAFSIINPVQNELELSPGEDLILSIRFNVPVVKFGELLDTLVINSNATNSLLGRTEIVLRARNDKVEFQLSDTQKDFANLDEFAPESSTFKITNNSTVPIRWDIPSPSGNFTIDNISPSITPPEGGESEVKYTYAGGPPGSQESATFTFIDTCGSSQSIILTASVSDPGPVFLKAGDICAYPGDTVTLPIFTEPVGVLSNSTATGITVDLKYVSKYLIPIDTTPPGILDQDMNRIISLSLPGKPISADTLGFYNFRVGDIAYPDTVILFLLNPVIYGSGFDLVEVDGSFLPACGDEIIRPVSETSMFKLYNNSPNPAVSYTNIIFKVKVADKILINIYDLSGKKLEYIDVGFLETGRYEIHLRTSEYSSGTYYYEVRNSRQGITGKMLIDKSNR